MIILMSSALKCARANAVSISGGKAACAGNGAKIGAMINAIKTSVDQYFSTLANIG